MSLKAFSRSFACLLFLLLVVTAAVVDAGGPASVSFDGSIKPISPADQAAPPRLHRPRISRKVLQPAESASAMDFEVVLKMRDFTALQRRVGRGERIARGEMSNKHYPLDGDYQRVVQWLKREGFQIRRTDSSRLAVFARGSVQLIQQALQVDFARVTMDGVEYTSAVTAPKLHAALAPVIVGVLGLQPHLHAHKHVVPRPLGKQSLTDTNPPYMPSQIAKAYNAQGLYDAGVKGAGQTIAIVIDTPPLQSDLTTFWQTYNVNQSLSNIQFIQVVPGTPPAPSGEESLDVEWSSSIAPDAKVRVYTTTDLFTNHLDEAYAQIFDDVTAHPELGIHQVSLSFGLGEQYSSPAQVSADSQYFANLASAGVTVFASSGDGGDSPGFGGAGDTTGPVQAETPSSDPNVTGVGGTSLTLDSNGNAALETAWSLSGGGASIFFNRPSWQTGSGVTGTMRLVPDVASAADPSTGAYVTLNGTEMVFGGTSWSSPMWAGFCALINQARSNVNLPPVGLFAPKVYPLLGSNNFRDITAGSNGLNAGPGYDLVTGVGVPNVQLLAQALIGWQTTPPALTVAPGLNTSFTVAASGTPVSYRWQRMPIGSALWSDVVDNAAYTGSATATLNISNVTTAMSGDQFQCVIDTGSQIVTTAPPSVLVVDTPITVTTLAGQALIIGAQDGAGTAAQFSYPSGVAVDGADNLYIADFNNDTIRKVTPDGVASTPYGQAGVIGSANGSGTNALFNTPNGIAADAAGNLYVADSGSSTIRKITPDGVVSTIAGQPGVVGTNDNPNGHLAHFNNPQGLTVDSDGNIFVADTFNYTVRKITPAGEVTTVAGTAGTNGYADGVGTAAKFNGPFSVVVDSQGNLFVSDLYNLVVRKIAPDGTVTTPYGQAGIPGRLDGVGTAALFNSPMGVAIDGADNLYVTDSQIPPDLSSTSSGNNILRRITPAGVVSTIAGAPGVSGTADGAGNAANFFSLQSVTVAHSGVLYLCDTFNQTMRAAASAPMMTLQPLNASILETQSVNFTTAVAGVLAPTYQWQRFPAGGSAWANVSDAPGAYAGSTTTTLAVSNAALAMNGDQFRCVISSNATPVITSGAATLVVQTGYGRWAGGFFTPSQLNDSNVSGMTATPQNDGIANLIKYLLDINPTVPISAADQQALPVAGVETISGTQYLTLTYRQNASTAGLTVTVQTSADLVNWNPVTPDLVQTLSTDPNTGDMMICVKVQTADAARLFIRLFVSTSS